MRCSAADSQPVELRADTRERQTDSGRVGLNLAAAQAAHSLPRRSFTTSPPFVRGVIRLADFLALLTSGSLITALYVRPLDERLLTHYAVPLVLAPLLLVALIGSFNGYAALFRLRPFAASGRATALWAAVVAGFTLLVFFLKIGEEFSRVWLAAWFVCGAAALVVVRYAATRVLRRWREAGLLTKRAVLIGGGAEAAELIQALEADPNADVRICGIFDDRDASRAPALAGGYPRLGRIDEIIEFGRQADIDMLIVALPVTAEPRLADLFRRVSVLPIDIRLSVQTSRVRFRPRAYSFLGSVPLLDVFDKPIAHWDAVTKRVFDVTIASAALVVLSPLMLATAAAIRLDAPGPVVFRQRRWGFNNEVIEVWKFRSMYHHLADPTAKQVVTRGDPRVTRVGRFIRKTSIDELPQLFNVIRGDLSLVGPRPHAVNAHIANRPWEQIVDGYFARHKVKPGVTGWAQVCGWRGEIDSEEKIRQRVEHDLFYIENWSILFDAYILFLTPFRLFTSENAY